MCIGLPMRVEAIEPGHARCSRRGETRRVRTALVGDVVAGDWLLVFLDSAVERLAPARAAEVEAALSLVESALLGGDPGAEPTFELPSRHTVEDLRHLTQRARS